MKSKTRWLSAILLTLYLPCLCACGGSGGNTPVTPTGLLYALDNFNKAIYVLNNVATLNGASDPIHTITGSNTMIQSPTAIADDTLRDTLYVADSTANAILAFIPASQTDGDTAPLRTYTGITKVGALYSDFTNNRLYAADIVANSIFVWDNISTLPSGSAPTRTIPLDYAPSSMVVDGLRNLLYVGDPLTQAVNIYANASSLAVKPPVNSNSITATPQPFVNINSLTLNTTNDLLFVAENSNPSVEMFNNASTLNGAIIPNRQLEGSDTALTINLGQIFFLQNVLYAVLNDVKNGVGAWQNANQLDGDTPPDQNIQVVPATQVIGIAVDLGH